MSEPLIMRQSFWELPLDSLNDKEWEALCDGCGLCCLVKLEDEDTGDIALTEVACHLFDSETCRCADYPARFEKVHDCLNIREALDENSLPETCAYRIRAKNRPLLDWHYLISGDRDLVHELGISVRHRSVSENEIELEDYPNYIIRWIEPDNKEG